VQAIVDFILELDKLKAVTRRTRPLGLERYENSAEHSWQIAMLAVSLAPHAGPVDIDRVVHMLLVHDIGEIDTGDTFIYEEGGWEARKQAERAAVARIFGLLPDAQAAPLMNLWVEFEEGATPEARFANAVDRAMPALLNLANGGQSWRENGITYERVVARIRPPIEAGCPALWAHLETRLAEAHRSGWFGTRPAPSRPRTSDAGGRDVPQPALTIRRATRDDLPAIVHLLADDDLGATREADVSPLPGGYHAAFEAIDRDPNQELVVGEAGRRVVAVLQLTFIPYLTYQGSWRALIEGVRVASDQRSGGIGRRLIEWCIDCARQHGCGMVQLTSNKSRTDAIRFYERLGFVASHEGLKLLLQGPG
jgi:putative hydrolases of HD superfamily